MWDDWNYNGINDSTEPDTDGDGIIDSNDAYPTDPWNNADSDSDGLTDLQEIGFGSVQGLGTDPYAIDTDNDDLTDYEEVMIYKLTHPTISPTNPKSLSGVYLDYQMVDATDTDLDGIPDRIEQWYAANGEPMDYTNPADGGGDLDGDRINNRTAYEQGWSLIAYRGQYDTDLDRMTDAQEDYWSSIYPGSFNKNRFADAVEDYDQDGLFNYEEIEQNLDPGNPYSRFTGITDGQYAAWQRAIGTSGYYGYLDGQPISTPPSHGEQADWDGDGIPEGYAAFVNDGHTVPNGPTHPVDQDNDGMSNEWEHRHQFDPRDSRDAGPATGFVVATEPTEGRNESTESEWQAYELAVLGDFDRDGLSNLREYLLGTHPKIADTDGDGINDGTEVQAGSNPTDINSKPTTVTPITPPRINLELSGIHLRGGTGSGNSGTGGGNSGGGSGNGNNNGPQPTEEDLDNATRLTPFIVQYSGWKGDSISSAGGSYSPGTPESVGVPLRHLRHQPQAPSPATFKNINTNNRERMTHPSRNLWGTSSSTPVSQAIPLRGSQPTAPRNQPITSSKPAWKPSANSTVGSFKPTKSSSPPIRSTPRSTPNRKPSTKPPIKISIATRSPRSMRWAPSPPGKAPTREAARSKTQNPANQRWRNTSLRPFPNKIIRPRTPTLLRPRDGMAIC
ncbi:hypothetical protein FEM03_03965 [Phragmitibacter flavus]|uniref:Uncharacterized protein n=1 Tax=Phragmitibacter flavus TaxID=2576071 RepID=A0A5R8KI35_9BACT|nr:hypothetical protein [Phragmitibacter flavus]TLD71891.1 hypothetical protein FEM03_03965 [Phragmitibacter flavus]